MCNYKTLSIQIVAIGPEKYQIQIPIFGKYKCSLNSIWFHSIVNINAVDIIRLNSPQFRLKYSSAVSYQNGALNSNLSSQPYPVFLSSPNGQIGGLNGTVDWVYDFQGTIELQLENLTGVIDVADICIITLNLEPIHD